MPLPSAYTVQAEKHEYSNVSVNFNVESPDGFSFSQFRSNWLYAHKFEAETTSQGWIGVHLELSKAMTESHTLIIWSFQSCALTIDKFHQVEKIIL